MKYKISNGSKQKVLELIIERGTNVTKAKSLVLKNKPMFAAKWLRYFTVDELDLYLEPETAVLTNEVDNIVGDLAEVIEEETQENLENLVEDNYYGI